MTQFSWQVFNTVATSEAVSRGGCSSSPASASSSSSSVSSGAIKNHSLVLFRVFSGMNFNVLESKKVHPFE